MAQARKRLPIDASAKCNGTRSGVSMIRMSSVASVADISLATDKNRITQIEPDLCASVFICGLTSSHAHELSLSNLDQQWPLCREIQFEITLRAPLAFNVNSALLDHSARFGHRRNQPQLDQK